MKSRDLVLTLALSFSPGPLQTVLGRLLQGAALDLFITNEMDPGPFLLILNRIPNSCHQFS